MSTLVLCVGRLKEKPYRQMADEYLKRLGRYGKYEEAEAPALPEAAGSAAGDRHGVVLVGSDQIPAVHGTPLLSGEVQGLVTRERNIFCAGNRDHAKSKAQRQNQGQEFLHLGFPP